MAQTGSAAGTLVGYFEDQPSAEKAVTALKNAGFGSAHLGVATRGDNSGSYAGDISGATDTTTDVNDSSTRMGAATSRAGEKAEGAWDKFKSFFSGDEAEPYASEKKD